MTVAPKVVKRVASLAVRMAQAMVVWRVGQLDSLSDEMKAG